MISNIVGYIKGLVAREVDDSQIVQQIIDNMIQAGLDSVLLSIMDDDKIEALLKEFTSAPIKDSE